MVIYVDASYELNKFAISTIVLDDGTAKSFFIPMKFKLYRKWFNTNQVIAELYAIYAAITWCKSEEIVIYTDNQSICKMINNESTANSEIISIFINIIKRICITRDIDIRYVSRKNNRKANDISLCLLRSIRKLKRSHSTSNDNLTNKVQMIPINYSLTKNLDLYNVFINKTIEVVINNHSYIIENGFCTNCFNGFVFKINFNWIKNVRR